MSKYIGALVLFQTFDHDVLNIVHVSIGGFFIYVERCSTMRFLAGTAQYLLNCILRANNGLLIVADGNDTCTCLRHFVPEKSASCGRGGQTIHFRFYQLKPYLSHTYS